MKSLIASIAAANPGIGTKKLKKLVQEKTTHMPPERFRQRHFEKNSTRWNLSLPPRLISIIAGRSQVDFKPESPNCWMQDVAVKPTDEDGHNWLQEAQVGFNPTESHDWLKEVQVSSAMDTNRPEEILHSDVLKVVQHPIYLTNLIAKTQVLGGRFGHWSLEPRDVLRIARRHPLYGQGDELNTPPSSCKLAGTIVRVRVN